jgi:hypothetical protein
MATGVFARQEVHIGAETLYCEDVDTFDHNIPALSIDFERVSGRATDGSVQSRTWDTRPGYLMPRSGGAVRVRVYAGGVESTSSTQDWLDKILAACFGGISTAGVVGVAGATATTISMPNATGTHPVGHIVRVGESRDGRAEGQGSVIGASASDLLFALPGAPAAGDVLRPCHMLYPTQELGATYRIALRFTDTPESIYVARGCAVENPQLVHPWGDAPYWEFVLRYGYWEVIDTIAELDQEDCDVHVCAGGSVLLSFVGTTSINTVYRDASSISITFNMGLAAIPILGPGRMGSLQTIGGWKRLKGGGAGSPAAIMRIVAPEGTGSSPTDNYGSDGSDSEYWHALVNLNAGADGASHKRRFMAWYAPRMYFGGEIPSFTDMNGLKYQETTWFLREGPDLTTPLTRSFWRAGRS